MWSNIVRSGSTDAGEPFAPAGVDAEVGERVDEHRLQPPDVRDDVGHAVAPPGQRDDRIADELTRAVVRDVTATVGPHELGPHRCRWHQDVLEVRLAPERVHVRVLEEEQVILGRAGVQRALECVGFDVRDAAEPP